MRHHVRPTLLVLGTAPSGARPGGPPAGAGAADLLAEADTVFAFPQDPESTALFYAEAWRVERVTPGDAVARVASWASGPVGAPGVLLVSGDPADDAAAGAVLDGLARAVPHLDVRLPAGARVGPPHRSPLLG